MSKQTKLRKKRTINVGTFRNVYINENELNNFINILSSKKVVINEKNIDKDFLKFVSKFENNREKYKLCISEFDRENEKKEWYLVIEKLDKDISPSASVTLKLSRNDKKFSFIWSINKNYFYIYITDKTIKTILKKLKEIWLEENDIEKSKNIIKLSKEILKKKKIKHEISLYVNEKVKPDTHRINKQRMFFKFFLDDKINSYFWIFLLEGVSSFWHDFRSINFLFDNFFYYPEKEKYFIRSIPNIALLNILKNINFKWLSWKLKFKDCGTAEEFLKKFWKKDKDIKWKLNSKCLNHSINETRWKEPFEYTLSFWGFTEENIIKIIMDKIKKWKLKRYKKDDAEIYWNVFIKIKNEWLSVFSTLRFNIEVSLSSNYSTNSYYIDDTDFKWKVYEEFLQYLLWNTKKNEKTIKEKLKKLISVDIDRVWWFDIDIDNIVE